MARRIPLEEPPSRLANWSRGLAAFALLVALFAVILTRGEFVEAIPGVVVLGAALLLAVLAILFALGAFVIIWFNGNPGTGRGLAGVAISLALLAYPGFVVARGYPWPKLADVSTDFADPPRFEAIARVRPRGANPIQYPGGEIALRQRAAYPDIAPLEVAATAEEAYRAALEVVKERKWLVIDARPPQANRRDGRVEVVTRTPVMGFRDDVVIRVRPSSSGALVDLRSASRYGAYDFGSNARRVRSLREDIEEEVGSQPAATR
jgi:uncharacterized protein (DUF1499 family)